MERIKMKTASAGPSGVYFSDKEYTVNDKEAKELVDAGAAEYVKTSVEKNAGVKKESLKKKKAKSKKEIEKEKRAEEDAILEAASVKVNPGGKYIFPDGSVVKGKESAVEYAKHLLSEEEEDSEESATETVKEEDDKS